jgi:hypothetical protein
LVHIERIRIFAIEHTRQIPAISLAQSIQNKPVIAGKAQSIDRDRKGAEALEQ